MVFFDFRGVLLFQDALIKGTIVTIELTFFAIVFGTVIGILLALGKLSNVFLIKTISIIYVEVFRAIPLLVLLVWFFFAFPLLTGFSLPPFETAVVAFSLSLSAFVGETIRAGIQVIPKGQIDAARAVGMSWFQTFERIVFPQAIRKIMPALTNDYINVLKLTPLASIIAVEEILHAGNDIIATTFRPLEVYSVIALIYLVIIIPLSYFSKKLEFSPGV